MKLKIRQEKAADHAAVYELVKAAFGEAEYSKHDEQELVERLRQSAAFVPELSLTATFEEELVGHIMFTRALIKGREQEHETLILAPVAVLPKAQRLGVGKALIETGHEIARTLGFKSVILVGHPGYYPRFGYRTAAEFSITTRLNLPQEVFMACELVEKGLAEVEGEFIFAKEFGITEND